MEKWNFLNFFHISTSVCFVGKFFTLTYIWENMLYRQFLCVVYSNTPLLILTWEFDKCDIRIDDATTKVSLPLKENTCLREWKTNDFCFVWSEYFLLPFTRSRLAWSSFCSLTLSARHLTECRASKCRRAVGNTHCVFSPLTSKKHLPGFFWASFVCQCAGF